MTVLFLTVLACIWIGGIFSSGGDGAPMLGLWSGGTSLCGFGTLCFCSMLGFCRRDLTPLGVADGGDGVVWG